MDDLSTVDISEDSSLYQLAKLEDFSVSFRLCRLRLAQFLHPKLVQTVKIHTHTRSRKQIVMG